jgi:rubrerythrin
MKFYKKDGKTRPITEKKGDSGYSGQTEEPSWKRSSVEDLKKDLPDERDDERAYRSQAKRAPTPQSKKTLASIADDEHEHQGRISKLLGKAEKHADS